MLRWLRKSSTPIRLGRWSTVVDSRVIHKRGEMADHDACGAQDCATPTHLAEVDPDDEWYARHYYDVVKKSKKHRYK